MGKKSELTSLFNVCWNHVLLYPTSIQSRCLFTEFAFLQKNRQTNMLQKDRETLDFGIYFKLGKISSSKPSWFFFEFELDFYCLCSLQKSISKSNWFFSFLNLIFWNWKKIEWHSISQKSSGDRQGDSWSRDESAWSLSQNIWTLAITALQYKPQWKMGEYIQTVDYNGARNSIHYISLLIHSLCWRFTVSLSARDFELLD